MQQQLTDTAEMKCNVNMEQLKRGPDANCASHLPPEKEMRTVGGLHSAPRRLTVDQMQIRSRTTMSAWNMCSG